MRKDDFMDYKNSAKKLRFNLIPYSKIAQLRFAKANLHYVGFKLLHGDKETHFANTEKR